MNEDMFLLQKKRLRRILRSVGWTPHISRKPSGLYAKAAKRDVQGNWHGAYIAPMHRLADMDTGKIKAVLPDIA